MGLSPRWPGRCFFTMTHTPVKPQGDSSHVLCETHLPIGLLAVLQRALRRWVSEGAPTHMRPTSYLLRTYLHIPTYVSDGRVKYLDTDALALAPIESSPPDFL